MAEGSSSALVRTYEEAECLLTMRREVTPASLALFVAPPSVTRLRARPAR